MPVRFRLSTLMIMVAIAAVVMALVANRLMLPVLAWVWVSTMVSSPLIATALTSKRRRDRGRPMSPAIKLALLASYSFLASIVMVSLVMAVIIVMKAR